MRNLKTTKKCVHRVSRINKFLSLKVIFPLWYRWYAQKDVDNEKIVFIETRHAEITNSFEVLYNKLHTEYDFKKRVCFLRIGFVSNIEYFFRCLNMICEIATAKYVFLNDTSNVISACPVRNETSVVQLWHGCGACKGFGCSTTDTISGYSRDEHLNYPCYKNYTIVTVSSPEAIWAYAEAMGLENEKEIIKPLGVSRTDVFFDAKFIAQARKNLLNLIPGAEQKKILLYAPTFRGSPEAAVPPAELDVVMLKEELGEEYILLVKQHPLVKSIPPVPEECRDFAFDVTKSMTIDDLLCVADICISDYSSLIFEYSLFERPMLFFAYDVDEYFDWRGFYYPYDNTFIPGPIVKTTKEIIDYIKHPERFDLDQIRKFKEKFMSSCDGHATERILKEAFGDDLQKHKIK